MKYQLITFGCSFNHSDAERAATVLEKLGYQKTTEESQADLIMVLACSVRQSAIDRLYGLKKKWQKIRARRPLTTILSGCILAKDKKKMAEFFDIILPIADLSKLPKMLTKKSLALPAEYLKIQPSHKSNFQAFVPIITGCNNFCAYCVVPYVRGPEVCRPAKDIVAECQGLINRGYKEITLIGQNVNSYKSQSLNLKSQNLKPKSTIDFPDLLKMVDGIKGDYWLRFMTSHPKDLSDKLIKTMAQGKHVAPYLHLPVQAGDDGILKKMNRRYTVAHYKKLIKKVRQTIPGIAISTDVIVGFPGETKKQFANSAKLFEEIKFDMAYLAQYSPRPGTAAAQLEDNIPKAEKKKREEIINEILKKTALANNKKLVGKTVRVLVEKYGKNKGVGKTASFKTVIFDGNKKLVGQFVEVKIITAQAFGLVGEIIK